MYEPKSKRPRIQKPKLNAESQMCFVRHFAKCYRKNWGPIRVKQKENLLKATLLSKSMIRVIRSLLLRFWLQNKIGNEFELQLEQGNGAKFRFSDDITFAFLHLVCPVDFRLCGHFGDFGNYARIDQLINLSKSSTELVAFKPTHEDNFILLLQSMCKHLNYLECDSKFLSYSDVPKLRIKHFKSSPSRGQVPLRDILRHQINCLDLRNDTFGACIADEECQTQNSLHTLMVKGSMSSPHEVFNYLEDVKVFAPNLKTCEIDFNDEISAEEFKLAASNFSQHIWRKFLSLDNLASKFEGLIDSLTIRACVSAEMSSKMILETNWTTNIEKLADSLKFSKTVDHNIRDTIDIIEIEKNSGFFKLYFKAKLTSLSVVEWHNNMLFERLNFDV